MTRNEAAVQPLDSFLADAGLSFDDIPVAMAIHRAALTTERRNVVDKVRERFVALSGQQIGHAYWNERLEGILDSIATGTEEGKP